MSLVPQCRSSGNTCQQHRVFRAALSPSGVFSPHTHVVRLPWRPSCDQLDAADVVWTKCILRRPLFAEEELMSQRAAGQSPLLGSSGGPGVAFNFFFAAADFARRTGSDKNTHIASRTQMAPVMFSHRLLMYVFFLRDLFSLNKPSKAALAGAGGPRGRMLSGLDGAFQCVV